MFLQWALADLYSGSPWLEAVEWPPPALHHRQPATLWPVLVIWQSSYR